MDTRNEIPDTDDAQKTDSHGHLRLVDIERTAPVDPFPTIEERPCWRVYDDGIQHAGRRCKAGVYWHDKKERPDGEPTYTDAWICAPLHVEAVTSNPEDGEYGRLLRFRSTNGRWKQWGLPMTMLAGDGREVLDAKAGQAVRVLDIPVSGTQTDAPFNSPLRSLWTTGPAPIIWGLFWGLSDK